MYKLKDPIAGLTIKIKYEAVYLNEKGFKKRKQFFACQFSKLTLSTSFLKPNLGDASYEINIAKPYHLYK
jgi:hypothetical protein